MRRAIVAGLSAALAAPRVAEGQSLEVVDLASDGSWPSGGSQAGSISDDGVRVAFASFADNLVDGDGNAFYDVFVRDRATGTTERVSVDSSGKAGNGVSTESMISGDGQVVAFESQATNLVAGDRNGRRDVFVHDTRDGTTACVSLNLSGKTANRDSTLVAISTDGTLVAFISNANDLVAGDTNKTFDLFVRDLVSGVTSRVSVRSDGQQAHGEVFDADMSPDGRWLVFSSSAPNLDPADTDTIHDVFLHDRQNGTTILAGVDATGASLHGRRPTIDAAGGLLAFVTWSDLGGGDLPGSADLVVRDLKSGAIVCATLDPDGRPNQMATAWIRGEIAGDGRFVIFESDSYHFVDDDFNGETDVFARDLASETTTRVSVSSGGRELARGASRGRADPTGELVMFETTDFDVLDDPNAIEGDVYLRTRRLDAARTAGYGAGLAGKRGVPAIDTDAPPVMSHDVAIEFDNSLGLWTTGVLLVGPAPASIPTGFGADLLVDASISLLLAVPPGGGRVADRVPVGELVVGTSWYAQVLLIDPFAVEGVATSAGLELVLGW